MTIRSRLATTLVITAMALTAVGCGRRDLPDLGRVQGTVTLDGKPLAGANVFFYPQSGGRTAVGVVDSQGKYELIYTYDVKGTKIGVNSVSVAYPQGEDVKGPPIPAKYGAKSELQADVKAGKNTFDFELKSK